MTVPKKDQERSCISPHFVYTRGMKNNKENTKSKSKPLTEKQVQDTLQEFRESIEMIRTRGLKSKVYGVRKKW